MRVVVTMVTYDRGTIKIVSPCSNVNLTLYNEVHNVWREIRFPKVHFEAVPRKEDNKHRHDGM